MPAMPDHINTFMDRECTKVWLSVYEDGEIVAQPGLTWEQALSLAADILSTALAVKRHAEEAARR